MRLINIFIKDLKAFFRDIRSFTLLFLTPIILVLLIGASFLSVTPTNIKIVLCSTEENEITSYIRNSMIGTTTFVIDNTKQSTIDECRQIINQLILSGTVRAGVIVPPKTEYYTTKIEVIVDNSKLVSEYIKSYSRIITNDISNKITKGYVDILFTNIDEVKKSLDEIENKLREHKNQLDNIKNNLASTRSSLSRIKSDMQSASSNIVSVINTIDASTRSIDTVNSQISGSISKIDSSISTVNTLNVSSGERSTITNDLSSAKGSLQSAGSALSSIRSDLINSKTTLSTSMNLINTNALDSAISTLDSMINVVESSKGNVDFALDKFALLKKAAQEARIEKPETVQFVDAQINDFFWKNKLIDFVFPSAVMMVIMIISTFLAAITFIRHRSTGLLQRVLLTPHGLRLLIIERLILTAFMAIIAYPIIIAVGVFVLQVNITYYVASGLFVSSVITALIFASIGLIIASVSKYESTAILLSIFVTLPMVFLSGIITPIEKLPDYFSTITYGLPLNILTKILETLTFYSPKLTETLIQFSVLVIYFIVCTLVAYLLIRRELRG